MIVVVDYGRGNLFSLGQALRHLGAEHAVTSDPDTVENAERIVFPGVGAFGDAMVGLRSRGLVEPLKAAASRGTPILGICVGCQLLLTRSEEFGSHDGLGIIPGIVARLPEPTDDDLGAIRIPNVGWRRLEVSSDDPIIGPLGSQLVYFVHSYAPMVAKSAHIAATLRINGADIPAAVRDGNVLGVQFHPEKSGPAGLELLGRFVGAKQGMS